MFFYLIVHCRMTIGGGEWRGNLDRHMTNHISSFIHVSLGKSPSSHRLVTKKILWIAKPLKSWGTPTGDQKRFGHTSSRSSSYSSMAAASTSMAATAALLMPRGAVVRAARIPALPYLPPRPSSPCGKLSIGTF